MIPRHRLPANSYDAVTKSLHWLFATSLMLTLFVFTDGDIHEWIGYGAFFILLVRLFKPLWHSSKRLRPLGRTRITRFNYFLKAVLVVGLTITGVMMGMDRFWGDPVVSDIHYYLSQTLIVLVLYHFVGLIRESFRSGKLTPLQMVLPNSRPKNRY